jgi:large subunit ribosomal protein L19e
MKLDLQKTLASKVTGAGKSRIKIDFEHRDKIKEAITKADIRDLLDEGVISVIQSKSNSRGRAKARLAARKKGRQRGQAKKSGTNNARNNSKSDWINRIRLQRKLLKSFKDRGLLASSDWKILYLKAKGGFFKHKRQLLQYMDQNKLLKKENKK